MEPLAQSANRLERFTNIIFSGKMGNGPSFSEFLVRLTVILREKDLHQATKNVIALEGENVNNIRPIPVLANAATTREAYAKDRSLTAMLMNSLTGDAFDYATQKFPISELTKDEDFIGLRLYMGLKAKYDIALIRSEVFKRKMEIFNTPIHGNVLNFIKEINNKLHFLLAHAKFSDGQILLLDEDIIQSILAKLPAHYNAFVIEARSVEAYSMTFSQFASRIENEEREMQVQRHHHPHQPHQDQAAMASTFNKKKNKKGKGKESSVASAPNPQPIYSNLKEIKLKPFLFVFKTKEKNPIPHARFYIGQWSYQSFCFR